ncbi:MAG: PilN domain-containing protein [Mastigocoleus sp. MO_167.B18]|nr:PilN domain-containing protein [Mastigocoleus sp. MO_167.B18]
MYSLDINFLQDRPSHQKKSESKVKSTTSGGELIPLFLGLAVAICLPVFVGGAWYILSAQNNSLESEVAELEAENQQLETEIGDINKIKAETDKIKGENQALVTVFDQIRPWSAMLQDLRDRIPGRVQLENIEQTPPAETDGNKPNSAGAVKLSGYARSFNDVNDFLLSLQQSRLFKPSESRILSAELVDAPIPPEVSQSENSELIKLPKVVRYEIQSSLSDVPASELMRELEQKGTVGLVARIRSLQGTGILQK